MQLPVPGVGCSSLDIWQTTIQTGFDQAMSSDICKSYDAQLEMAIAIFFNSKNIADQVVKFIRFEYMLK